jgi:hypothetical protein
MQRLFHSSSSCLAINFFFPLSCYKNIKDFTVWNVSCIDTEFNSWLRFPWIVDGSPLEMSIINIITFLQFYQRCFGLSGIWRHYGVEYSVYGADTVESVILIRRCTQACLKPFSGLPVSHTTDFKFPQDLNLTKIEFKNTRKTKSYLFLFVNLRVRDWNTSLKSLWNMHIQIVSCNINASNNLYVIHTVHVRTVNFIQYMHSVIHHLWYTSTPTCFDTKMPSSVELW